MGALALGVLLAAGTTATAPAGAVEPTVHTALGMDVPHRRIAGADAFATAAAISADAFDPFVPAAYVATSAAFADALAGGAAAARDGAPVLLTSAAALPSATAAELRRLQPARIVILGGTAAVSTAVERSLRAIAPVERRAGLNRFATAADVSQSSFGPGVGAVFVASGLNHADALGSVPAAASVGAPILLVQPASIPAETIAELWRLQPRRIYVLGGTAAVSAGVATQLAEIAPVQRVAGVDRYDTSAIVARTFSGTGIAVTYVANGVGFTDALAGGPAAVASGGSLVLVPSMSIPPAIRTEVRRQDPGEIIRLGGFTTVGAWFLPSLVTTHAPTDFRVLAVWAGLFAAIEALPGPVPMTAYLSDDSAWRAARYLENYPELTAEETRSAVDAGSAVTHGSTMYLRAPTVPADVDAAILAALRQPLVTTAAHEYVHNRQYALVDERLHLGGALTWMVEGQARYHQYRVVEPLYPGLNAQRRASAVADAKAWTGRLEDFEGTGIYSDILRNYAIASLAIERLIQLKGAASIEAYFTRLRVDEPDDAFRAVFGMSSTAFSGGFRAWIDSQ